MKNNLIDSDSWTLNQGILENKPIFIRVRDNLDIAIRSNSPFQIGVAVSLLNPTKDGLPTNSEGGELVVIEDRLDEVLGENPSAIRVMTITTDGMREFIFYTSVWEPQYFEQKVKGVGESIGSGHELQFTMQEDKEWQTFTEFSGAFNN